MIGVLAKTRMLVDLQKLDTQDVRKLEYVGGGYFRMPGPVGKSTFVIRAPELVRLLLERLEDEGKEPK